MLLYWSHHFEIAKQTANSEITYQPKVTNSYIILCTFNKKTIGFCVLLVGIYSFAIFQIVKKTQIKSTHIYYIFSYGKTKNTLHLFV